MMNERIKELAEQSLPNVKFWNEELIKGSTPPTNRAITPDELEKFVELIVKECAKVADLADGNKCEWIGGNILTHFGVEK